MHLHHAPVHVRCVLDDLKPRASSVRAKKHESFAETTWRRRTSWRQCHRRHAKTEAPLLLNWLTLFCSSSPAILFACCFSTLPRSNESKVSKSTQKKRQKTAARGCFFLFLSRLIFTLNDEKNTLHTQTSDAESSSKVPVGPLETNNPGLKSCQQSDKHHFIAPKGRPDLLQTI